MRDPLRNVSVRYKLAFAFFGVCLLAFGVGGYFVSSSARASLEGEILAHLGVRSRWQATMFEGALEALRRRARDFASDGFIRTHFAQLGDPTSRLALREHLRLNKLPLEPAFIDLALVDATGAEAFLAVQTGRSWAQALPRHALGEQDWFSGLLEPAGEEGPPTVLIATPLWSLEGDRVLGALVVRVNAGVWIAGALRRTDSPEDGRAPGFGLVLRDASGRSLEIPSDWVVEPPLATSHEARSSLALRVREHGAGSKPGFSPGVLSESFPIAINNWSLETTMDTREALAPVSGLQARFLLVAAVLTALACLLLLFPMRFLARPIGQLKAAAVRIREGDFSVRVPVESRDELGELSSSFNLMAEAVEGRTEELRFAAHSLEQRRNELRSERDRLNAVIHSMRDALIVIDPDGEPEVWNASAEPLVEIVRSGGLDLSAHRNCLRPGAGNSPMEPLTSGVAEHGEAPGAEHPCFGCLFDPTAAPRSCLIDAGPLVFEVHSTRLAPDDRGRSGRVLVARDITDRVAQDEREIHQERLAALGEVAAVMAHELNNPLAAIKMFAQMIESKLAPDSDLREDVSVIERNTQTCSRTIRELLDYATGATPEVGPVDVHATVRDVSSFLRAFRERRSVELVLELEAEDPIVMGDEVQLRQVFVNLVMNALQAVGEGVVVVRTSLEGSHLVVDVRDTGPGIEPAVGDTVFRPFFTTKPRGSGTGLGLSTARRITEIQGGGLELVDGTPGQTTFRVRLLRRNA